MLEDKKVARIVSAAARKTLGKEFIRTEIGPTIDSRGESAIRVLLVIKPGAADRITGDAALDSVVGIQRQLQEAGEEDFPIIEFATEEELAEVDDT
jgi:hypothetical protein